MVLIVTKKLPMSSSTLWAIWFYLFFVFTIFWSIFYRFLRWSILYPEGKTVRSHRKLSHLVHGAFFFTCIISALSSSLDLCFTEFVWTNALGLLMLLDAIILTTASQYLFSKYFRNNTTPILITKGIYRFNRHPYYLGLFELSLSCSFIFHSYAGLIGAIILWGIMYILVRQEEKVLRELFRDEFETYYRSTLGIFIIK